MTDQFGRMTRVSDVVRVEWDWDRWFGQGWRRSSLGPVWRGGRIGTSAAVRMERKGDRGLCSGQGWRGGKIGMNAVVSVERKGDQSQCCAVTWGAVG